MTTIEDINALGREAIEAALSGPPEQAAAFIRSAAQAGAAEAQLVLGQILLDGHGVERDPIEGLQWFVEAAKQDNVMAMNMVGRCYENGWGIAADVVRAAEWYRAAADRGSDWGMYNLATLLALGHGVEADREAALALFRDAAALGHVKSVNMIGSFYEDGWVVGHDMDAATEHYRRAAEGGDFRGMFNYARMLIDAGRLEQAVDWLNRLRHCATPAFLGKVREWLAARQEPILRQLSAEYPGEASQ